MYFSSLPVLRDGKDVSSEGTESSGIFSLSNSSLPKETWAFLYTESSFQIWVCLFFSVPVVKETLCPAWTVHKTSLSCASFLFLWNLKHSLHWHTQQPSGLHSSGQFIKEKFSRKLLTAYFTLHIANVRTSDVNEVIFLWYWVPFCAEHKPNNFSVKWKFSCPCPGYS